MKLELELCVVVIFGHIDGCFDLGVDVSLVVTFYCYTLTR